MSSKPNPLTDAAVGVQKLVKSDAEWKAQLSPLAYEVARKHATERPFSSPLDHELRPGTYTCVCCGEPVFVAPARTRRDANLPHRRARGQPRHRQGQCPALAPRRRPEALQGADHGSRNRHGPQDP